MTHELFRKCAVCQKQVLIGGTVIAHNGGNYGVGGYMTQSLKTSDSLLRKTQPRHKRTTSGDLRSQETSPVSVFSHSGHDASKPPIVSASNDALCCDARNCLQVILSGTEILLEDHLGNLLFGQKELLTKMSDNIYQLNSLLSMLIGPEELRPADNSEEDSEPAPYTGTDLKGTAALNASRYVK